MRGLLSLRMLPWFAVAAAAVVIGAVVILPVPPPPSSSPPGEEEVARMAVEKGSWSLISRNKLDGCTMDQRRRHRLSNNSSYDSITEYMRRCGPFSSGIPY